MAAGADQDLDLRLKAGDGAHILTLAADYRSVQALEALWDELAGLHGSPLHL